MVRPVHSDRAWSLGSAGEWLVALVAINGMLPLPARPAEILETLEIAAEVWPHHSIAHCA